MSQAAVWLKDVVNEKLAELHRDVQGFERQLAGLNPRVEQLKIHLDMAVLLIDELEELRTQLIAGGVR